MARIRTIKPEFWTDSVMVQLPPLARLFYIGLWNFVDDDGAIEDEPEAIVLKILPAEPDVDPAALIDLLIAAGRIDRMEREDGSTYLQIARFDEHQKIDKRSASKITTLTARRKNITNPVRQAVAAKYGMTEPKAVPYKRGYPSYIAHHPVQCYYCGTPGELQWHRTYDRRTHRMIPLGWITCSLEWDHFVDFEHGGETTVDNIVLACRSCNRGKRDRDGIAFTAKKNPHFAASSQEPPEPPRIPPSPAPGSGSGSWKGRDQGEEGKGQSRALARASAGDDLPKTIDKAPVTHAEREAAALLVDAFNQHAHTAYTTKAHGEIIIRRLRHYPDVSLAEHQAIITAAFRKPWWKDKPAPNVIYGSDSIFERMREQARAGPDPTNFSANDFAMIAKGAA